MLQRFGGWSIRRSDISTWLLGLLRPDDRRVAIAGVGLSLLAIAFILARGLDTNYIFPASIISASCASWFLVRRIECTSKAAFSTRRVAIILVTAFFVLLTVSIISLQFRPNTYERPLLFFVSFALMAGVIAAEIPLSSLRMAPLILGQIFITGVLLTWSGNVVFPNVIGLDNWWHQFFTRLIVESGQVPGNLGYSGLPLFHLLIGQGEILLDVNFKTALLYILVLSQLAVQMLITYVLARTIFGNHKIALFSALSMMFAVWAIVFSMIPLPTSFGFTFVLLVLYFLLRMDGLMTTVMMLFLTFVIVWSHTIASVCMLIVFASGFLATKISWDSFPSSTHYMKVTYILFFVVAMLAWWAYAAGAVVDQFSELILWGFSRDVFIDPSAKVANQVVPLGEALYGLAGIYLFYGLAVLGALFSISHRGNAKAATVSTIGLALLGVGLVAMVGKLGFLQERWFYYSQVLLAVPLGAALYILSNASVRWGKGDHTRWKVLPVVAVAVLVASLAFIASTNPKADLDNHALTPTTGIRFAFTESEIQGAAFASTSLHGTIYSDYDFGRNPSSSVFLDYLGVDVGRTGSLDDALSNNEWTSNGTVKVVRTYLADNTFRVGGWNYRLDYDLIGSLYGSDLNKVYANGALSVYV